MLDSFMSRSFPSSSISRAALACSWPSMNCDVSWARVSRDLLFSAANTCARRLRMRCAASGVSSTYDTM